jgi:hypothetical protein
MVADSSKAAAINALKNRDDESVVKSAELILRGQVVEIKYLFLGK